MQNVMNNIGMKSQNRFGILEHLDHDVDFKTTQETIRELYYEIEQHKP
jgi:hypothetical protein